MDFNFRGEEVMSLKSDKHPCVTLALIASMPKVFEAVQDKCISKANCKKDSKLFYVSYTYLPTYCAFNRDFKLNLKYDLVIFRYDTILPAYNVPPS